MRTELKLFRVKQKLSQAEMAEKIGCSRATYQSIENGKRVGRRMFWKLLQASFNLSDLEIESLQANEK